MPQDPESEMKENIKEKLVFYSVINEENKSELLNSFELLTISPPEDSECNSDEKIIIDEQYLKTKLSQFAEVFPDHEFLGWYSTGSQLFAYDTVIQKQLMAFNESPVYLLMDSVRATISKELPLKIFDSEVKIVDNQPEVQFFDVPYKIETLEAERIAVDHIAHAASTTGSNAVGSGSIAQLSGTQEAINMLNIRIKLLLRYLRAVQNGELPKDLNFLRQIKSICRMLPAIDTQQFKNDLLDEYNDTLLMTYLASITKTTNAADKLGDIHNFTYERQRHHRRFPFHMGGHAEGDDLPTSYIF
eukprot:CAMPEP_0117027210 /NCGR_PEP_ID=MMETSP0472-20121206/19912_1 /TAXON_ID=693140 ORGANISM="Tiarina fusus, Strain LIS" /NCGR_SAMPLE_ID=MMETSP0472 /ASSEMBLY_ACC=CAM_ASM_000603 /LENGTH=301 /DNA_ID=CAMNT_0004734395 /DNA_START=86 /DNA_END=990 /DNA_ORIENTATION=+